MIMRKQALDFVQLTYNVLDRARGLPEPERLRRRIGLPIVRCWHLADIAVTWSMSALGGEADTSSPRPDVR
jgi:hypothetical protein